MTKQKALRIFEKYNPAEAVTRCPNGRAPVRKQLDVYAQSAVNLYGVILLTDFTHIFNSQNEAQINNEEVFTLLLPIVLKRKRYCFYGDCIAHYWAMEDFGYADYLLHEQSDKPRYVPNKDEFLKYENEYYEDDSQRAFWRKINSLLDKEFPDNLRRYRVFNELRSLSSQGAGLRETVEILDRYNFVFSTGKTEEFFNLLMEARNNTRLRENKGYTPNELVNLMVSKLPKGRSGEIVVEERKKVGRNAPCPCGSGKKYKHCCLLAEDARTAQLTTDECALFYTTWYGLMGFINEKKRVISADIKPVYPNAVSDEQIYKVREVLWKTPELITEYIAAAKLTPERTALLESWRDHYKKGMFFVVDYKPDYAVMIGSDDHYGIIRLFGIKGISRSLSDAIHRELPINIETVLLPFKDKIIYDGFIGFMPISFAEGAKNMFREMYDNALEHGIIAQGDLIP